MDILYLIDKVESLIATGLSLPFMGKVIVDREQLLDVVDQMRTSVPKDVNEAQDVLRERDDVIAKAREEERRIIQEAQERFETILQGSEITRAAEEKARQILKEAEEQVAAQRKEADSYALGVLQRLEVQLVGQLNTLRSGIDSLDKPPS